MQRLMIAAACFFGSTLAISVASAVTPETRIEKGFTSLFDGKSLDGWDGNPELWSVEEGAITGTTTDQHPIEHNEFLIWKDEVSDFVLKLQFRVADYGGGNSGIQYRSHRDAKAGKWVVGGYQADIDRTNRYMGILYEERGRGILAERGEKVVLHKISDNPGFKKEVIGSLGDPDDLVQDVKAGQWIDYEIVARGNHLVQKVHGNVTAELTDNDDVHAAKRGILALQIHTGPAMKIQFRNIRIRHEGAAN